MVPTVYVRAAAILVAVCCVEPVTGAEYRPGILVRSGDAAPGFAGDVRFNLLVNSDIDNAGNVSFLGYIADGVQGFWAATAEGIRFGAVTGEPIPGLPGESFAGYYGAGGGIRGGRMWIYGAIVGTAVVDPAILLGTPGAIHVVSGAGRPAPGFGPDMTFGRARESLSVNDSGEVLFVAQLERSGSPVDEAGLWAGAAGDLDLIARSGSKPPGLSDGVVFGPSVRQSGFEPFDTYMLNDGGDVAFTGKFEGPGVGEGNNTALWIGDRFAPQLAMRKGDAVRVDAADYVFGDMRIHDFNNLGAALVAARLLPADGSDVDGVDSLWVVDGQSQRMVVRVGGDVPADAPGVTFAGFTRAATLNDAGQVAFTVGESDGDLSVWMSTDAGLVRVLAEGQLVPGNLGNEPVTSLAAVAATINNAGQVLLGSVVTDDGYGYWVRNVDATLLRVAGEGDVMHFGEGLPKVVDWFTHHNNNFNDLGQAAMSLYFTDGSSAIARYSIVPEPSSWALLLVAAGCAAFGRGLRRRNAR